MQQNARFQNRQQRLSTLELKLQIAATMIASSSIRVCKQVRHPLSQQKAISISGSSFTLCSWALNYTTPLRISSWKEPAVASGGIGNIRYGPIQPLTALTSAYKHRLFKAPIYFSSEQQLPVQHSILRLVWAPNTLPALPSAMNSTTTHPPACCILASYKQYESK